jgi:hypothetical protein
VDGVGGVPWPRSDRNRLKRSRALCQWRCHERRVVRSRGDMASGSLSEAAGVGQAKLEEHRGRRKRGYDYRKIQEGEGSCPEQTPENGGRGFKGM